MSPLWGPLRLSSSFAGVCLAEEVCHLPWQLPLYRRVPVTEDRTVLRMLWRWGSAALKTERQPKILYLKMTPLVGKGQGPFAVIEAGCTVVEDGLLARSANCPG